MLREPKADDAAGQPFAAETTLVIRNPVSGRPMSRRRALRVAERLRAAGYTVVDTSGPGAATELAANAVRDGVEAMIVIGGDGTLYETLQGASPALRLAQFPTGTVNLLARALNVPRRPDAWWSLFETGAVRRIYLGRCNDYRFTSVASIGLDARAVKEVNPRLKRWIQEGAYGIKALQLYPGYRPPEYRVFLDGEPVDEPLLGVLVGNGPCFGGPQELFPEGHPEVPHLNVLLLHGERRRRLWCFTWGMLTGSLPRMRDVSSHVVSELVVEATPSEAIELDGEYVTDTPVTFRLDSEAWTVLAPAPEA